MQTINPRLPYITLFLLIFTFLIIRTAWLSDDIFITFRTILNWLHGAGPVFNIGERVQAYTHPLWFLLLSGGTWLFGNIFYVTFGLSIILAVGTLWLLLKYYALDTPKILLLAIILCCSKAFIDYSTSGLENVLAYFLLTLIILSVNQIPKNIYQLSLFTLLASLLFLTRADLILLIAPLIIYICWQIRTPHIVIIGLLLGSLPAVAWLGFSTFYYGFPFPNTAYAKLGAGIPTFELVLQGGYYFLDSLDRDPITLLTILFSLGISFFYASHKLKTLAIGIMFYLLYILFIGGDFMSGRFFAVPLLVATILLIQFPSSLFTQTFLAVFLLIGFSPLFASNLFSNSNYKNQSVNAKGVADERAYYFQERGLITGYRQRFNMLPWKKFPLPNKVEVFCDILGVKSLQMPTTHIIDPCALTDPFLARLPVNNTTQWRIGHFIRPIPSGYAKSIETNTNQLHDPALRKYYEKLRLITHGELFSLERLSAIWAINQGTYQPWLDNYQNNRQRK